MSLRWAARYAFSEDLWRSRARVVLDPALEDALLSGIPVGEDAESLRELVDALLPARPGDDASVWVGVSDDSVAARLSRLRPGTSFVARSRLAEVLSQDAWEVALIDLDAAPRSGSHDNEALDAIAGLNLKPSIARSIVLWGASGDEGLGYEDLAEAMLEQLGTRGCTQRIFGLYRPPMAAIVDFGESLEIDGAEADLEITISVRPSELRDDDEEQDVPLYFDNSLGAQEPPIDELIGVCSAAPLPEGLGLIELPPAASGQPSGLRAQLHSAQQRAQRSEVEQQRLLDRLDALQRENRELREAVEAGPDPFDALARDEALEASMAREQALKWKVTGLEHQLSKAVARPVEDLEAEVARLSMLPPPSQAPISGDFEAGISAQESASAAQMEPSPEALPEAPGSPRPSPSDEVPEESVVLVVADEARDRVLAAQLNGLVQRLERGGIGVLALRRALASVARRLRTPPS
ncbi:MAG: hypothetical protein ACRBN8_38430 [Nannocystales bacterium]